MEKSETEERLLRYIDGTLNPTEIAALSEILKTDAGARASLRDIAEQAFVVGELGKCRVAREPIGRPSDPVREVVTKSRRKWLGVAAAAAIAVGAILFIQMRKAPFALEVVSLNGAARWSANGREESLTSGRKIPSGLIRIEGEASTLELRTADGTRFTLSGSATVEFRGLDRKEVNLEHGTLTASVAPQPQGKAMLVRTGTAEVIVLGTVFSLDATQRRTNLSVAEGQVRLKRLIDNREVEVEARQQVRASLRSTDPLEPRPIQSPSTVWHFDLSSPPEEMVGDWHAAGANEPAFISAIPSVAGRYEDGRVLVHQSVVARPSGADTFASLTSDSIMRLKLRIDRRFPLQVMIATRFPDGRFAGNFELVKEHTELAGDGAWHELEIPIGDLKPIRSGESVEMAGRQVSAVIVTTLHEPVGLCVAGISILPSPTIP
ncbi:MAG: FecR domain-containing protein [Verrucomicrobiae bacterium]|nr:FecR domain-containing protein [Verrucomicrobiae bacterium]